MSLILMNRDLMSEISEICSSGMSAFLPLVMANLPVMALEGP